MTTCLREMVKEIYADIRGKTIPGQLLVLLCPDDGGELLGQRHGLGKAVDLLGLSFVSGHGVECVENGLGWCKGDVGMIIR